MGSFNNSTRANIRVHFKTKVDRLKETCVPGKNLPIILTEVESLLEKGATEPVPISQINSSFTVLSS